MLKKPLEGMIVVTLEQAVAAPLCSSRLADAGARVIKVERETGDFARGYDTVVHGESAYFVWTNRGKESLVLNLKDSEDQSLLHRILAKADVFLQNLAAGATARLGFDSDLLREKYPRLVTCDISGYGEGPYRDMKAYDFLIQSESGIVSISGAPQAYGRVGVSICDIGAGLNAYGAILQALLLRERSGKGSGVKVSLFDTAADWMTVPLMHHDYGGRAPQRVGLMHPTIAPYGGYQCKNDEIVVISIQNNREWATFCKEILQRPDMIDDARFCDNHARVANREQMDQIINAVFGQYTRSELGELLNKHRIAFGAVNSVADFSAHPQLRRKSMPVNGEMAQMVASPIITDYDDEQFAPLPELGEHTVAIRAEFLAKNA